MATTRAVDPRARRSRELIMTALADVVAERGVSGFSIQEVADRAGVSHRTVYRHYESRDALLDGYARWLDEKLLERGGVTGVDDAESIPPGAETTFRLFDEFGALFDALVVVSLGTRSQVARRDERTGEFRAALEASGTLDHLAEDDADVVTALIRTIASSNSWFLFRHLHGVDGERAGRAVAWALQTLIEELRSGGGPQLDATSDRREEHR
ncbi:MAG: TetR/AcrR family transcriptional regulator [Nitriliruptorales bacterium]|nr:TetR/AcrR family transcriptional regulator [Nitriliruptorales bacterium]